MQLQNIKKQNGLNHQIVLYVIGLDLRIVVKIESQYSISIKNLNRPSIWLFQSQIEINVTICWKKPVVKRGKSCSCFFKIFSKHIDIFCTTITSNMKNFQIIIQQQCTLKIPQGEICLIEMNGSNNNSENYTE